MEKLDFVDSMHEQREFNTLIVPCEGCWVEVGEFTPGLETWKIFERWLCTKANLDEKKFELTVHLKKINHQAMDSEVDALAEKVLENHSYNLINSFRIAFLKGMHNKRFDIERRYKRATGTEKTEHELNIEYLAKEKKKLARLQEKIARVEKELEDEKNEGRNNMLPVPSNL